MYIHEVNQYISLNIPEPQFYIKDLLPKQGHMLLYGNPKVRKSWLSMHMGFCIASGTDFLDFRTEQARVLLVQFEISDANYHFRMRAVSRHFELMDNTFFIASPGLMYLDNDDVFQRFAEDVSRVEPKVIILDCMSACFGGDENDGEAVARFIRKLAELSAMNTSSIILVHHTNKNVLANSNVDRARGHSRLAGWVDTLVYMHEIPAQQGEIAVQLQMKSRQATRELHNTNVSFREYNWNIRGGANTTVTATQR